MYTEAIFANSFISTLFPDERNQNVSRAYLEILTLLVAPTTLHTNDVIELDGLALDVQLYEWNVNEVIYVIALTWPECRVVRSAAPYQLHKDLWSAQIENSGNTFVAVLTQIVITTVRMTV